MPAQIVIRVEKREKMKCEQCEGQLVRAPVGDRIVSGGRFGSRLAGQLLVDKYDDGLPLHRERERLCRKERPSSPLGRAVNYLLNHQQAFTRFLCDGCVPIDNGAVERLHVRAALTRKNFLFAGSDAGGHRAAIAYTILGSCRLAGVNPEEYLADVLPRLARSVRVDELDTLLPASWRDARAAAAAAEAAAHAAE